MKPILRIFSAVLTVVLLNLSLIVYSQPEKEIDPDGPGYAENCTSIMVGRLASTDGSVMTSHTCDGRYRTWLGVVPAMKFARPHMHSSALHTPVSTKSSSPSAKQQSTGNRN
jgi:hypothetical protein